MLIPISNTPRDYAWGSTTLLAALQGRVPSGAPEAEVWFGDHPGDPADIPGGTLDEVTGGALPYLVKLLAAGAPLSIQAHPAKAQAEAGFAREAHLPVEERTYQDDNHKPELIVALSERFEALAGLRPLEQTRLLLGSLPRNDGMRVLRERLEGAGDSPRAAIEWALAAASPAEIADIAEAVDAGSRAERSGHAENLAALARIAQLHPGDGGLVVALLMNHVVLGRGEAIFLPAGVLHAYLSGLGVEVMAASDNVLRGGLTVKAVDVAELLAILDSAPAPVPIQHPDPDAAVAAYRVPVPDFALRRVRVEGQPLDIPISGSAIVIATRGEVAVTGDAETRDVPVGGAVFATADERMLRLSGSGEAFIAQPG